MDVESRDGWTFLRLVSTNNTWQWTNRVASPSYTNTIRAVCSFSQKKKNWKFLSPFFGYFFVIYSPHRFKYEWGGGEFCDVCDGWVFYFIFSTFLSEKMGGEFSDFQRFIVYIYPWTGSLVEWVAWPGLHILDADARLCAVWCLWSAEGPLLFFPFYLLELLDGSPIVCGMGCEHVICLWSFLSLFP